MMIVYEVSDANKKKKNPFIKMNGALQRQNLI